MPVKILMVCLGNICRSPLAEGILASKLPLSQFTVASAGTENWHVGKKPDARSIAVAQKNGLNISSQRARQFSSADFDTFDFIYAMDTNNYADILSLAKIDSHKNKVHLLLNALYPDKNNSVPDPYYGLEDGFDTVFKMLDEACSEIAVRLLDLNS